ncbi:hypothetical protein [Brucella anthropi]|uniref:hypothetical protein n=1 Tax=Brucella anthropi TaxID=529 RepID=UPI00069875C1|nr:hypothetical protein [Brucella anthropi]
MIASLSKPLVIIAMVLGFLSLIAFFGWRTVSIVEDIIRDRVTAAETARDAHWRAEVEAANAVAAGNIIAQMRAARAADLAAQAEIDRLKSELSELESKNANLPDSDGSGIDVERARLLNDTRPIANRPH